MKSPQKQQRGKPALTVEWYVAESDNDWSKLCSPSTPEEREETGSAVQAHPVSTKLRWELAIALFLLLSTGGWWWQWRQQSAMQAEAEVRSAVKQHLWEPAPGPDPLAGSATDEQRAPRWPSELEQTDRQLRAAVAADKPGAQLDLEVRMVELQGNQAVVTVLLGGLAGGPTYRQTRFYQRTATVWQRMAPDAALWGPALHLESTYFRFNYHARDAAVVATVAPQIDAIYATLRHTFGLANTPASEKIVVEVSPTEAVGHFPSQFGVSPPASSAYLVVPSPALYVAPVDLTDADLLAQSVALHLLNKVLVKAIEEYGLDSSWYPLLEGLRLWQLWDLDLPLAAWRKDLVKWLYVDLPAADATKRAMPPEEYETLCATYKLWMQSPMQLTIPLLCSDLDWEEWYTNTWHYLKPPLRLVELAVPRSFDGYAEMIDRTSRFHYSGYAVALATLLDYAATAYGRDRLPMLVAGLAQHDSWETLIPAVYGVSATVFEAGWQAYLAERYPREQSAR